MSLDSWFSSDVTIQRGTEKLDAYNNNALPDYYDVAMVPGRLIAKRQTVWQDERAELIPLTVYTVLIPAETDVRPQDRVMVDSKYYIVLQLLPRNARAVHHMSLSVERVD